MKQSPVIVWFRQDLRLADNPALTAAVKTGAPVLPLYILDDEAEGRWAQGAASRVWLHHSLDSLNRDLSGHLVFLSGKAADLLPALARKLGAGGVYWNRCYEPWLVKRDAAIEQALTGSDITARTFNGVLLREPREILKKDGTPYKVFTPYYKAFLFGGEPGAPLPAPKNIDLARHDGGAPLDKLGLLPDRPRWDKPMMEQWQPGEQGARRALSHFLATGLKDYKTARNIMAEDGVSRMSPRLHHGELSPRQVWHAVRIEEQKSHVATGAEAYLREIVWREFNYSLLHHFPDMPHKNFQPRFDKFPWDKNANALHAWQRGLTGYPVVDAAMRQMWQTGWMHNRARLITGSFLCKHLLTYWEDGQDWFWDCLVDADLANNACNWQWIAGTGADAAPYFRIFNPVTQGEKFDADGAFVRRFVPELAALPDKYLHKPWLAPPEILQKAGIELGKTYPKPVVDHDAARQRALAAFQKTKS